MQIALLVQDVRGMMKHMADCIAGARCQRHDETHGERSKGKSRFIKGDFKGTYRQHHAVVLGARAVGHARHHDRLCTDRRAHSLWDRRQAQLGGMQLNVRSSGKCC